MSRKVYSCSVPKDEPTRLSDVVNSLFEERDIRDTRFHQTRRWNHAASLRDKEDAHAELLTSDPFTGG